MTIETTRYLDQHGEAFDLLPEGTRVRSVRHPELTGVIKHYEWHESGHISPIPYCIGWDDSYLASQTLGFMFVYASVGGVEPLP